MTIKEKILDTLIELGFDMEDMDFGYTFKYEGINMLWTTPKDDEDFLSISVPCIDEITDDNSALIHSLIEDLNSTLKYVKTYVIDEHVWIFYERELIGEEDLRLCISHMIMHLEAALRYFIHAKVKALDDDE